METVKKTHPTLTFSTVIRTSGEEKKVKVRSYSPTSKVNQKETDQWCLSSLSLSMLTIKSDVEKQCLCEECGKMRSDIVH